MKWLTIVLILFANPFSFADPIKGTLKPVENKKVCMVNDTFFGRDQIPVKVKSNTYYGCCENCKKTLAEDPKSRMAEDPVSKKSVDKSIAVIGATDDGKVYYFESKANLEKFNKQKVK